MSKQRLGGLVDPKDVKHSANVQLRRSRVQKCKGERGEAARGHVGTVTRGQERGQEGRRARGPTKAHELTH